MNNYEDPFEEWLLKKKEEKRQERLGKIVGMIIALSSTAFVSYCIYVGIKHMMR